MGLGPYDERIGRPWSHKDVGYRDSDVFGHLPEHPQYLFNPIRSIDRQLAKRIVSLNIDHGIILRANTLLLNTAGYYRSRLTHQVVTGHDWRETKDPVLRARLLLGNLPVTRVALDFDGVIVGEYSDPIARNVPGSRQLERTMKGAEKIGIKTLPDKELLFLCAYLQFVADKLISKPRAFVSATHDRDFKPGIVELIKHLQESDISILISSRQFDAVVKGRTDDLGISDRDVYAIHSYEQMARGLFKGLAIADRFSSPDTTTNVALAGDSESDISMLECQHYGIAPAVLFVAKGGSLEKAVSSGKYSKLLSHTQVFPFSNGHDIKNAIVNINNLTIRL